MARSFLLFRAARDTSHDGSPQSGRPRPSFGLGRWPIHAYFIALVVLFVVVAGAGALYVKSQSSHDARRSAQADARYAAGKAAKQLDTYFAAIHGSVAGLVANPLIANSLAPSKGLHAVVLRRWWAGQRTPRHHRGRRDRGLLLTTARTGSPTNRLRRCAVATPGARPSGAARPGRGWRDRPADGDQRDADPRWKGCSSPPLWT